MTPKNIAITLTTLASLGLGGDAAIYNGATLIDTTIPVAEEVVALKQVDNVVEATFPWKDQAGIKVKYDLEEPTVAEKFKDKRKKEVITETVTDFEGGFKVDLLLNEKPDTNVFCYAIQGAENYDFFFQPPLTEQEKAEGASRPPEIEGSYAVYHKTLKNHEIGKENYATGKVMHIPRPQVWSMSDVDTKVWADMQYDNGQLCVTVPQDFLEKAEYPVRVDPTFGYTSIGASSSESSNYIIGSTGSPASSGTVTMISVYYKSVFATKYNTAIYTSTPTLLAGGTEETSETVNAWNDLLVSASVTGGSSYYVVAWANAGGAAVAADTGSSGQVFQAATYSASWPTLTGTGSSVIKSIYATYTASGGGGSSTTPKQNIILFE